MDLLGVILLSAVYLLGMGLAKAYLPYQYKCLLMTCEPATWKMIQDFAFEHAKDNGKNYLITTVSFNSMNPKDFAKEELDSIDLEISYMDPQSEGKNFDNNAKLSYPIRGITFNDRKFQIRENAFQMWSSDGFPSSASQEHFRAVKIGPREVYPIIQKRLQASPQCKDATLITITLRFGEYAQEEYGIKSVWEMSCWFPKGYLLYAVDAENGKIVNDQLEFLHK